MPTYREDLHTGHKVPLVEADDIVNGSITHEKLADDAVDTNNIKDRAVTEPKLADNSVSTRTIQNGAVTGEKIADGTVQKIMRPITSDLQNQIDSFNAHGLSVSNHFGNDKHIGISQYALTQAINRIWQKIDDMTDEVTQGIGMTVTPEYYIGEEGCSVHIVADSYDAHGIFEVLDLYVIEGDEERHIYHGENVEHHGSTVQISDTAYVKCKAQILGIEYEVTKKITHYASFWLGAGASYSDVMTNAHLIPASRHMRGAYDITANGGDRIFVIVGESLAQGFIRADMNGIEIAMTESTITKDGNTYKVFTSQDTYQAGTYNIDVNG